MLLCLKIVQQKRMSNTLLPIAEMYSYWILYALIMADKYSYPEASYNIFGAIKDFKKNNTLLLSEMMRYYLLYGAKNGSSSSCFQLKEYYEKGILFERNQRKAKFYENKINEIYKIKWTK